MARAGKVSGVQWGCNSLSAAPPPYAPPHHALGDEGTLHWHGVGVARGL